MKIWAHRGCCTKYPENTLTSFAAACRYDIDGIELDIQLTSDDEIVVIHDEKVDRTTNGTGWVKDFTLAELKMLEIAAPKGETEHIPTMREVLELTAPYCRAYGMFINIEMKNSKIRYEGMEEKILTLVAEFGLQNYIIYSSFNQDSIVMLKQLDPSVQTGILKSSLAECCALEHATNCDALHPDIERLDEPCLRTKTQAPVRAWNVAEAFYPSTTPRRPLIFDLPALEKQGVTDIIVNQPENFVQLRAEDGMQRVELMLHSGTAIDYQSGTYAFGVDNRMATLIVMHAPAGSTIKLLNDDYEFAIVTYNAEIPKDFIYTYCYDRDSAWVTYKGGYTEDSFTQEPFTFGADTFFRVCLRRRDNKPIPPYEAERSAGLLLYRTLPQAGETKRFFKGEIFKTAAMARMFGRDCVKFALLADSHYVTNGFWEDTVNNLREVNNGVQMDGIVHLGDLTDGILPQKESTAMMEHCIKEMQGLKLPLLIVPGNHDSAYFSGNPEPLSEAQEQQVLYKDVLPDDVVRPAGKFWYYRDLTQQKLRILVLFSHDFRANPRYGFPDAELDWVRETLATVPEGWKVLVFSHCPPLPELHYWSKDITNGSRLIALLDEYNSKPGCRVLAFIHGHNHCEQISRTHTFPIISIGCAKCEYFTDKKPEGSYTEPRQPGTLTQELWDVMLVDTKRDELRFIRFGAGKDRLIEC